MAENFPVVDFDRLVREHPRMRQYDPRTGRFTGTPSEIREVSSITAEIEAIERELAETEQRQREAARPLLLASDPLGAGTSIWAGIRETDARIAHLKQRRATLTELAQDGGNPTADTMIPLVADVVNDVLASCPLEAGGVVLNRFPRFPSAPPAVEIRPPGDPGGPGDPPRHEQIIRAAPFLGPLFPSSDRPILYAEGAMHP
ncbi:MAG TPA: hypothetical protein VIV61_01535 [Candidatus Ozemobacteraceae bacterium]